MEYKQLGKTGINISTLTIGNAAPVISGKEFDDAFVQSSVNAILTMIDNGANFIDTAASYADGLSERIVGKVLEKIDRTKVIVNTKFGIVASKEKHHVLDTQTDNSYENCIRECEDSLKRLHTDYIDLYMPHHASGKDDIEQTMAALKHLQQQGKIRFIGLSNFSAAQIRQAQQYAEISMIEMPYSMIDRFTEPDLKWATDNSISTMTYGALGNGMLTGRYRMLPKIDFYDTRLSYNYFKEPEFSKIQQLLVTLDEIAAERNVPLAEVAINWTRQRSYVTTVILGTSSEKHALNNCKALRWQLSEDENRRIADAIEKSVGDGVNFRIVADSEKA